MEKSTLQKPAVDTSKTAEALIFNIEWLDSRRSPVKLFPRNFLYHDKHKLYPPLSRAIEKNDPVINREIEVFRDFWWDEAKKYYRKQKDSKDFFVALIPIILIIGSVFFNVIFTPNMSIWFTLFFALISSVMIIMYYITKKTTKCAEIIAQNKDKEIEITAFAQKLINYTKKFFKENNIDPANFPLQLRHDDYSGLHYEKRGEHEYIAYVDVRGK